MNDPRSAFSEVTRCARDCGATVAYPYPSAQTERAVSARSGLNVVIPERDVDKDDAEFVEYLRSLGWQVVNGEWTCPNDLPDDRRDLPGAMGRRRNPYCSNCGDTRGGAFGHETSECTWSAAAEPPVGSVVLVASRNSSSERGAAYQRGAAGWHAVNVDACMSWSESWSEMNEWAKVQVVHHA